MEEARTQPVHPSPYPFTDVDSIRYELPPGYDVEAMPDPVTYETSFAMYEAGVRRREDRLVYHRRLEWRKKTLPPDQYRALRRFLQRGAQADQAQAVLVKEKT